MREGRREEGWDVCLPELRPVHHTHPHTSPCAAKCFDDTDGDDDEKEAAAAVACRIVQSRSREAAQKRRGRRTRGLRAATFVCVLGCG